MTLLSRVLDPQPVLGVEEYVAAGGGRGLTLARKADAEGLITSIETSGLRGRGGAGFPTGRKWRTVSEYRSPSVPATVVVNAAEGEPGSFKDRAILRANPYRVLEGALIGARAVGADRVIVAMKASFRRELDLMRDAITDAGNAGWLDGVDVEVFSGPSEYLYGEETALLEVLDGRHPFPRVAPPFRHGVDEAGSGAESAARVELAGGTQAPPTLVDNVETFANVAAIVVEGPEWFRSAGTEESPGTVVCTVSGHIRTHGVGEFAMGTPLREVIETIGGRPEPGRRIVAAISGVANAVLGEDQLDTLVTYEDMERAGSGLGACGFIVFDDDTDMVAVAHGISRFLAVESCGQCTPCKQDGLAIADLLEALCRSDAAADAIAGVEARVRTVSNEARCFLAHQHEQVIGSILRLFPDVLAAHASGGAEPVTSELIAPIVDIVDGVAVLDDGQSQKQPDWSYDELWSGKSPADLIDERRAS
jgi:NADH-quinone oxidoreductase subunit F